MMTKKILIDYDYPQIEQIITSLGEPKFRAGQVWTWLCKGVSLEEMKNLPKSLLAKLSEEYVAQGIEIIQCITSAVDGTQKYLFQLQDGNIIEGVLMKYKYGHTICVSTQVGCRMNCSFCASGLDGLIRNLTAGEILGQVYAVNKANSTKGERVITNIVLMGSGEPLDNYDNVTQFLKLVSQENTINISKRNISLSTCGLCDKIYKLADDGFCPTMTISLHAPNDEARKKIMPIANKYSVVDIIKAVRYYFEKTGRRIIFEYSMIDGVNDSAEYATQLAKLVVGLPCHINLIRLNYVKEKGLHGAKSDNVNEFLKMLESKGISCTIRRTMGSDIDGACGQLRAKYMDDSSTETNTRQQN